MAVLASLLLGGCGGSASPPGERGAHLPDGVHLHARTYTALADYVAFLNRFYARHRKLTSRNIGVIRSRCPDFGTGFSAGVEAVRDNCLRLTRSLNLKHELDDRCDSATISVAERTSCASLIARQLARADRAMERAKEEIAASAKLRRGACAAFLRAWARADGNKAQAATRLARWAEARLRPEDRRTQGVRAIADLRAANDESSELFATARVRLGSCAPPGVAVKRIPAGKAGPRRAEQRAELGRRRTPGGFSDRDRVRATVETYLSALADGNGHKACKQLTGEGKRELVDFALSQLPELGTIDCVKIVEQIHGILGADEADVLRNAKVTDVSIQGDAASATIKGATTSPSLKKSGGRWLINSGFTGS